VSYVEAVISGIVQGLTEFLPISSSGHLVILHHLLGYKEPKLFFDIFLHIGTLFTVLVYFWRDIIKVASKEFRLLVLIVVGSIPAAVIGFFFKDIFEGAFADIRIVGFMLFITAGFLFLGDWAGKRSDMRASNSRLGWFKALIIGLAQALSIMPGLSRSGSTISTGLFLKLKREEAIRFSFLLSIPVIIGALLLKVVDVSGDIVVSPQMIAGSISAFLVGLGAIYFLIRAVLGSKLKFFAIYCILVGGILLAL